MQIRDFHVGQAFTHGRSQWRCTDIGQRTIAACPLETEALGPSKAAPYAGERLFTEEDIAFAHLTPELAMAGDVLHHSLAPEQILSSAEMARQDRRRAELKALTTSSARYPATDLAEVRVDPQGHSWSAHAAHRDAQGAWQIEAFDFHAQAAKAMPEAQWLGWPFHAADPHVTVSHPESGAHGTEAALRQLIREELQRAGRDPIQADAFLQQGHASLEWLRPLSAILGRRTVEEPDSPAVHALLTHSPRQRQAEVLEKALRDWIAPLMAE